MQTQIKTKQASYALKPAITVSLIVLMALLGGFLFAMLLTTHYYAAFLYVLLGLVFYVLVKCLGRETAFAFMIPLLCVALVLTGRFYLLDFYNFDDMNPLKIHPFVLAWLVAFSLLFLEDLMRNRVRFDKIMVTAVLVIVVFTGVTLVSRGFSGIMQEVHNYIGPISFFLFYYYSKQLNMSKIEIIVRILIWIAVIIGIFGLIEYVTQTNIFQQTYNEETPTWLDSTYREGYRIKTILGHPLDNAVFFIFAMILVQMNVKKPAMKFALLGLFAVDILLTGSRSFFIASFLVLLYNPGFLKSGTRSMKQQIVTLVVAASVIGMALISPLGTTFMNRFESASDSTEARILLYDYFLKHLTAFKGMGLGGATENIVLLDRFHNPIYLENPWIILFFDIGYLVVVYLAFLLLIFRKIDNKFLCAVFLIAVSGYNSFGVKNNANYFLFFLFAYGYLIAQQKLKRQPAETPDEE